MGYYLNIDTVALKNTGQYHIKPFLCSELVGFADDDYNKPIYKKVPAIRITRLSDGKVMAFDRKGSRAYCHCSYGGRLAAEVKAFVPANTVTRGE